MRILTVNNSLDAVRGGGTSERTFQFSRALARRGIDCSVLTTAVGMTAQRRGDLRETNLVVLPALLNRYYLPRCGAARVRGLVRQADVIHLMGVWSSLNVVVHHYAQRFNKPYVHCPAGDLPIFGRSRMLKRVFLRLRGRSMLRGAEKVIAISPREIPVLTAHGINPQKIAWIPNGIDPGDFPAEGNPSFRQRLGIGEAPYILFVAKMDPIKGPDLLLEAFRRVHHRFPEHHLVLGGPDSGLQPALERRVNEHGLQRRVHFPGYLGGREKVAAYREAELLAISSRQEAMSIVVLEAGCCGTPVLLTDQCGFNEVESIGGGCVVPATAEGLAEGLARMLEHRDALPEMGRRLQQFSLEHYSWEAIVQRYLELFADVANRPVRGGYRDAA